MKDKILVCLFSFIMIFFFSFNILTPDNDISISERRRLKSFPKFSINSIFNGELRNDFDNYVTDQFVFRDSFRKISAFIDLKVKGSYHDLFLYNNYIIEDKKSINYSSINNFINKVNNIKSLCLKNSNKVYYSIIPEKMYFASNKELFDTIEDTLKSSFDFKYIKIDDTLRLNSYYKSDPHWKQEELINTSNRINTFMNNNSFNDYNKKKISNFKGTYYYQLPVFNGNDELFIMNSKYTNNSYLYDYVSNNKSDLYSRSNNSIDLYDTYLGGSKAIISIINKTNTSNKELIVFRDSFASSISPLLLDGYSKITLIDTRYISPNLISNYIEFDNQDILFLYSTLIINNSYSLK